MPIISDTLKNMDWGFTEIENPHTLEGYTRCLRCFFERKDIDFVEMSNDLREYEINMDCNGTCVFCVPSTCVITFEKGFIIFK